MLTPFFSPYVVALLLPAQPGAWTGFRPWLSTRLAEAGLMLQNGNYVVWQFEELLCNLLSRSTASFGQVHIHPCFSRAHHSTPAGLSDNPMHWHSNVWQKRFLLSPVGKTDLIQCGKQPCLSFPAGFQLCNMNGQRGINNTALAKPPPPSPFSKLNCPSLSRQWKCNSEHHHGWVTELEETDATVRWSQLCLNHGRCKSCVPTPNTGIHWAPICPVQ